MTVLFAGGRLDSLSVIGGTPTEIATTTYYDTTYCDAVTSVGSTAIVQASCYDENSNLTDLVSGDTGWFHLEAYTTTNYTGGALAFYLVNSAGQPWLAIRAPTSGTLGVYYNSGTGASPTWTLLGSGFSVPSDVRHRWDLKLTLGSPHTVSLVFNGNVMLPDTTFTQASLTSIRGLRINGATAGQTLVSQVLIAKNRSTVNAKVKYLRGTAAGANTGWGGAVTNVNEAVNSDATFDSTTTAGVKQTYTMGDVTVPATYSILGVYHFIRAKNDGAAPANVKSVIRQGTTDYDYATNLPGISSGFLPLPARYDTDPATGTLWTQSAVNSAEFGYLSVT